MTNYRFSIYRSLEIFNYDNSRNYATILLSLIFAQLLNNSYSVPFSCSLDEVNSCFRRVFGQFNKTKIFNCDDFRIFAYCYDSPSCSGNQTSAVASKVFREITHSYLPKEFFSALFSQWTSKCNRPCERFDESQCRRNMQPADKDYDHALLLEWHGQRLQFELGMVPASRGCATLRNTMSRWHSFRLSKCPKETALCYCTDQQNRLDASCSLNCNILPLPNCVDAQVRLSILCLWYLGSYLFIN